jgi:penicillin-binding protein 1B
MLVLWTAIFSVKEIPREMRRIVIIVSLVLLAPLLALGIYASLVFKQLEASFEQRQEWIPTRLYSDVTRISLGKSRPAVEKRLKALGYATISMPKAIEFTLHPLRYPDTLLPSTSPTRTLAEKQIPLRLEFDAPGARGKLNSIRATEEKQEAPEGYLQELFLEPEFIGALQPGGGATRKIREWNSLAEIPPSIWQAILAIEDQHFLQHIGLDWGGMARAVWVNLRQMRLAQGGSTITQQLVKNLMERHDKDLVKKANEVLLALLLEFRFSKERILERYLNEVYLGQIGSLEIHGVAEGAKYFFNKRLEEISTAEAALMAGLIRGPSYYSPYRQWKRSLERQKLVLRKMHESGYLATEELLEALRTPLQLSPPQAGSNAKAPFFVDFVKDQLLEKLPEDRIAGDLSGLGLRVYTTLQVELNDEAQRAVTAGVARIEKTIKPSKKGPLPRLEGALAAVDHSNGFLRALVGGRDYASSSFNRILNMSRQVGSTFKPFVFLAAIQKRQDERGMIYGPGYPVEDAPFTLRFDRGRQSWAPRNYEPEFRGWITLRDALADSINTATARVALDVGIRETVNTARALGITSELPEVPSLALGVAELSPVELLKAYAAIANHGQADGLSAIRAITQEDGRILSEFTSQPQWVADPASVDLLIEMMSSVFSEGTASIAKVWGWTRPAAGKTGTTSQHRDSWFAGFTPQLTAVTWVGWDQLPETSSQPTLTRSKLTGANAALPIWVDFMKTALEGEPPTPFPPSSHLLELRIDRKTGMRARPDCPQNQVVTERYIQGREPREETCASEYPHSIRERTQN